VALLITELTFYMKMETNSDSKVCTVGIVDDTQVQKPSNPERDNLIKTYE
jgi:hypothetical protein